MKDQAIKRSFGMKYDFLIVGAGLFGSVFAEHAIRNGKSVLIVDKREHIGGNCYTKNKEGINIHVYGPHIFHTSNEKIWDYVNQFSRFNHFRYSPKVNYKGDIYSFPINLMTLNQLWGIKTPDEAKKKLEEVRVKIDKPKNLEEWALSQVGEEVYEIFIKGYTSKQWMRSPKDLPASIIKRLPIRLTYDENYFNDSFQGIPIGGYTGLINNMIDGSDVELGVDFFKDRDRLQKVSKNIVYTGKIDEYFNYEFGDLEYRTQKFLTKRVDGDFQGTAGVNYTDIKVPFTRIIEHKHFEFLKKDFSYVTRDYPDKWNREKTPYYPINDDKNTDIYKKYKMLSKKEAGVIFGGRLAEYRYFDMHQVIGSAMNKFKKIED